MPSTKRTLLNLVIMCLTAAAPAAAQPQKWEFRLRGLSSNYSHEFVYPYLATSHLRMDNGSGFEIGAEFRPRRHLGLELSAGRLVFDARAWTTQLRPISFDPLVLQEVTLFEDTGQFVIQPYTFALLFHLASSRPADVYFAPLVTWTRYEVKVETQEREPEFGYGAKAGLEYRIGSSPWIVGVEYRHVELVHETLDRDQYGDIGLDIGSILVAYRVGRNR